MEKKGNRNSPALRGTLADSKKDGVSKQWPRGSRRRETAGAGLSVKNEPSRKPQPQRVKNMDKRPKPRGNGCTGTVARNETPLLEEPYDAELGLVLSPGSKKQSLNHLLNFSYITRDNYPLERRRENSGGKGNRMLATKKHKYNKEHFLQANCQFVVNSSGNYKQYMNNPDALVDWEYVEQVNVQVSEFPSCPICLYPPVAAKITRCGHIYCWPCILHFLSLSDKPSRKCPICYENVNNQDLKSVIAIPHNTFNVKETISFKLMKRLRDGLVAYPVDAEVKKDNILFEISEKNSRNIYSKLLLAKDDDVLSLIEREYNELHTKIDDNFDYPDNCFVEQAILLLEKRKFQVLEKKDCLEDALSKLDINTEQRDESLDMEQEKEVSNTATQSSKFYYFYQACDGQHIYLHALNARMLEHTYGSLEFCPKIITGSILEKEGGSMTEDIRKRFRYLQHLPLTCQFEVAEIDLKLPIIGKETMDHFREQIEIRKKRRERREREEKRREKRIETEENRKMGKYPTALLHLESNIQFPQFGSDSRLRTVSESTLPSERSSPNLADSLEHTYAGPSFATMLASDKKQPPSWPSLKTTSNPFSAQKLMNISDSKRISISPKVPTASDTEMDFEDYQPVPSFSASFGDAIAEALQKAAKTDDDVQVAGKKKKKVKQKILFATNMAYSGK